MELSNEYYADIFVNIIQDFQTNDSHNLNIKGLTFGIAIVET